MTLGSRLKAIRRDSLEGIIEQASYKNQWFTPDNIRLSFDGLIHYLEESNLKKWLGEYNFQNISPKKVGVVMAGNIPMVGVHDMICVLLSGHKLLAKLSQQDDVLLPFIAKELIKIDPGFGQSIEFVERLNDMEAVIATGSDNTARYFDYYFSKYPNIIRKNRTSVAIINGEESTEDLANLGHDIFDYFGLGCRNVSKLFLPVGYELSKIIDQLKPFKWILDHHKYNNNYFYQKSIFMVDQTTHQDNGFVLFQQNEKLVSPIAVIYYEYYKDIDSLKKKLLSYQNKIQCVVGNIDTFDKQVAFGKSQSPGIEDYADNIDTMDFLTKI